MEKLVILFVVIMTVFFSSCQKTEKEMDYKSKAGSGFSEPSSGPYLYWNGESSLSLKSAVTSGVRYSFYIKAIYEDSTDYTIETFNKSLNIEDVMLSFLSHTGHGRIIELQAPKDLIVMLNPESVYMGKKTIMYNLYGFPKEKLVEKNKLPEGLLGIITFILGIVSGVFFYIILTKKKWPIFDDMIIKTMRVKPRETTVNPYDPDYLRAKECRENFLEDLKQQSLKNNRRDIPID